MPLFRYVLILGLLATGPARAATEDAPRRVFEYVDEAGVRRFTSDPRVAAEVAPQLTAREDEDSRAVEDGNGVAESLAQYLKTYAATDVGREVTSLRLDVRAPDLGDREAMRRAAERVELLATLDPSPGAPGTPADRRELATLLFTPLRAIYPAAHLVVTVHDGVHTVARADWDPAQGEPQFRVK